MKLLFELHLIHSFLSCATCSLILLFITRRHKKANKTAQKKVDSCKICTQFYGIEIKAARALHFFMVIESQMWKCEAHDLMARVDKIVDFASWWREKGGDVN
jgi:hypothetical protein